MYNLAKYPDIQEKCYQEVINVIGDDKSKHFSYAEFNQLNYMEKVIKESLRLYPSVPAIGRYVAEECDLSKFKSYGIISFSRIIFCVCSNFPFDKVTGSDFF